MAQCAYTEGPSLYRCHNIAQSGKPFCAMHRDMAPPAVVVRHGRYSKYLPKELMQRFFDALDQPDILSLVDDIALIDTRVGEVLSKIAVGELKSNTITWDEITDRLVLRKGLVESERKRMIENGQSVTIVQLMALLRSIANVVNINVADDDTRSRIAAGIADLVDSNAIQAETVLDLTIIPEEKRRWSHTDDSGNPDPKAPLVPVENLDPRLNHSASRNNHMNPIDPETGKRVNYGHFHIFPETRRPVSKYNPDHVRQVRPTRDGHEPKT